MTILVTGSAGFIGFHLCKKLLKMGLPVIGIDNFNNYYDPDLKEKENICLKKISSDLRIPFSMVDGDIKRLKQIRKNF